MSPPAQLPLRQLTENGPKIPAIGFGLMGISIAYGAADSDEDRLKVLDRAWELGCTNWDSADIYGDCEDLLGKWFKLHPERRADIFLATKFGFKVEGQGMVIDSSPEYALQSAKKSLQRLGVEHIDLYYMHRANEDVPIEKTVEAMKQLVTYVKLHDGVSPAAKDELTPRNREGKVKYLGLSEVSSTTLRRAHAVHPITAIQAEYNPWSLEIEGAEGTNLLKTCTELGVSIFAYSPLGRGILTGRFRSTDDFEEGDARKNMARFQGENLQKNLKIVDTFHELAEKKGCTPSQLTLAWILEQSPNIFVIPGTKKVKYLEDNLGAARVQLSKDDDAKLRKVVSEAEVQGGRDPFFGCYADTAPLKA